MPMRSSGLRNYTRNLQLDVCALTGSGVAINRHRTAAAGIRRVSCSAAVGKLCTLDHFQHRKSEMQANAAITQPIQALKNRMQAEVGYCVSKIVHLKYDLNSNPR